MEVIALQLRDDGAIPNSRLPLLIYRLALAENAPDMATAFESAFCENDWRGTWRNGIYPYHHYHSTAHEVLGCYRGSARVIETLSAGDVVIIPAGLIRSRYRATRSNSGNGNNSEGVCCSRISFSMRITMSGCAAATFFDSAGSVFKS